MREVLGDSVDAAARAKAAERSKYEDAKAQAEESGYELTIPEPEGILNANERFGIIRTAFGAAGRSMPDEAIRIIANGETTAQRLNTFRLLAGGFDTFDDAAAAAKIIRDELSGIDPRYAAESGTRVGYELSAAAQEAADSFDFAMFSAFEDNLILSQRRRMKPDAETSVLEADPQIYDTLNEMPIDLALAGLEDLLGKADDLMVKNSAINLAEAGDGAQNLLSTGVFVGQIKELPFGRRLQELARQHRVRAQKNGADYSEYINPNTAFGSSRRIRFITERLPHTHIFFTEANAIDQFERVLTQASRVDEGRIVQNAGISINEVLGEFTAAKIQGDYRGMEDLYNGTIRRINNAIDDNFIKNEDFGSLAGIDVNHRTAGQMWEEANDAWIEERQTIVGVTNPKGELETSMQAGKVEVGSAEPTIDPFLEPYRDEISLRVIRDENAEVIVQQFGFSPSQVQQSAVLPRYDIIYQEIENWNNIKTRRRVKFAEERAKAKGRDVDAARTRALVPITERLTAPLRSPANTAYGYWRKSVLSTPKWPMRVQIDEQMRIAANIGALSTIANFRGGFERMRQAQAVHKLDNWDELKKTELLEAGMRGYADKKNIDVAGTDIVSLYDAVGPKGFDAAVKDVTKKLVLDGRARGRLRRNYFAKGALFGTFMGQPLAGVAYGLFSKASRRRRINEAAQQTAALHYAGALKVEGRRLLAESVSADDLSVARQLMSDAEYISKNAQTKYSFENAKNAFDTAEELLEKAGFAGITIGRNQLRNAFGDDGRFVEQIEASNSANEALSSIYRSAHDTATRELEQYAPDYAIRDYLERPSDEAWQTGYSAMLNRLTTNDAGKPFYETVWANLPEETRIANLTQLFYDNPQMFTDLVQNSVDLGLNRYLTSDDYGRLAEQIVQEFDAVLPVEYFPNQRAAAAAGDIRWNVDQTEWNRIWDEHLEGKVNPETGVITPSRQTLEDSFETEAAFNNFIQRRAIEHIRQTHSGFGKTFTPKTITGQSEKQLRSWVDEKFDNIFSVLAEIPSDQLSRHPFFASVYQREVRRIISPMVDDAQQISLSQKKINEIENFAREQALTETRELLYDLRETTRVAEVLANVSPFLNAWQEVIGRWSGIAVDNPTFVANVGRLYSKEWEASALGLSQVEDENGNTYVTFRLTGPGYDEEGEERTIFDVMPESIKNRLIPAPLRSTNNTVRFSKDSLNTMLEGSPGVGPMITIPVREAIVGNPQLEDTMSFMFPFGHPQGGVFDRLVKANLPSWAKAVDDVMRETHRYDAVQTRMFRDLVIEAQASGEFIDWADEAVWRDFEEEANSRADQWFAFKFGTALLSPASTTMISPYEPLKQEYRDLQEEHGKLIAEDMFLTKYGEDFFALTSALSRSNDGLPASVTIEERREEHKDLIEVLGDSGVGAYVVGAVGSDLEQLRYSQAVQNAQFLEPVSPGSKTMRRELFTGRELIETNQSRLGWRSFAELTDWVKGKQDEAAAAGLSTNLNSAHLRAVSAIKQLKIAELAEANPSWAAEYSDVNSSPAKRNSINDAFIKVLSDPVISQRDSARHIAEYYRVRMWVQDKLQTRKREGGSAQLENSRSNADLLALWEQVRTQMSLIPQFAPVFERYFTRDMLSEETFIEPNDWPEGFLINV